MLDPPFQPKDGIDNAAAAQYMTDAIGYQHFQDDWSENAAVGGQAYIIEQHECSLSCYVKNV